MASFPSFMPPPYAASLVGRSAEMRALEAALARVRESQKCEIVTVSGAAGVGKTRLVRDFITQVERIGETAPVRVYRGSSREDGASYGVFARILRSRFGLSDAMEPDVQRDLLREKVALTLEDRKVGDVCFFLGQLLEISFVSSPLVDAVMSDAQQTRALRYAVLKRFLETDAREDPFKPEGYAGPIVLVFDDLQHAHDESLDLLELLMNGLDAPILIVCVTRAELFARRDAWTKIRGNSHKKIDIGPLSDDDSARVMQKLLEGCGDGPDAQELASAASNLAGGNPALMEQMIRIFLDIGVLKPKEGGGFAIHLSELANVKLPLTVQDAVNARIAALSQDERLLLERAAAMGGVFWLGGLVAIGRTDASVPDVWSLPKADDVDRVRAALKELRDRDYVLRLPDSTFPGDEEYVFKHNLERETLAKQTPSAEARGYHHAIADWLALEPQARSHEETLGMLARHRELAGLVAEAGATFLEAGDIARAHYANAKASDYYQRGLQLLAGSADGNPELRLNALHHYGDVLQLLGKNGEALAVFRDMLARAFRIDARGKGGAAHSRIGRLHRENGRLDEAKKHLEAALALFEDADDERGIASTVDDIGKLHWLRGDYEKALEFTQRGLAMRRRLGDRRSISLSLNNLGLVYQDSGQFKMALDAFEQALRIRREIGDLVGVCMTLNNLGTVAQDQRDDSRAIELFKEALEVAKETGDRNRTALVLTNIGEAQTRLGDPDSAVKHLHEAEEICEELGDKLGLAEAVRGLGKAHLAKKDFFKAREFTERAVEIFREIQSKVQLGVALRSLGEVMALSSEEAADVLEARGHLLQSIWIFEEIGNDVELARSARIYAKLLQRSPEYQTDAKVREESKQFEERAEKIFQKMKISMLGLDADAIFGKA